MFEILLSDLLVSSNLFLADMFLTFCEAFSLAFPIVFAYKTFVSKRKPWCARSIYFAKKLNIVFVKILGEWALQRMFTKKRKSLSTYQQVD